MLSLAGLKRQIMSIVWGLLPYRTGPVHQLTGLCVNPEPVNWLAVLVWAGPGMGGWGGAEGDDYGPIGSIGCE